MELAYLSVESLGVPKGLTKACKQVDFSQLPVFFVEGCRKLGNKFERQGLGKSDHQPSQQGNLRSISRTNHDDFLSAIDIAKELFHCFPLCPDLYVSAKQEVHTL